MIVSQGKDKEIVIMIPDYFSVEQASELRKEMSELFHKNIIMDFKNCSFIDSTGLGVIVAVYKRCMEAGGSLKLRSMNPNVYKIFKLTRLDKVFEIN
ncbi:putative anti-sigma factor antagonist [Oxobacter pfennigii]|uniref:Anti-sigma factor antagonist n=1 Tax=Oxobacter pfennigii TaxID=36849 RepID=A0A0P8W8W5_9CLOT|nr:STAS domain-containing protein [Oxobacter pfennigii]KPU45113.1 putative anti-sigma factor antagonist [Oxobacter pfennigii]